MSKHQSLGFRADTLPFFNGLRPTVATAVSKKLSYGLVWFTCAWWPLLIHIFVTNQQPRTIPTEEIHSRNSIKIIYAYFDPIQL